MSSPDSIIPMSRESTADQQYDAEAAMTNTASTLAGENQPRQHYRSSSGEDPVWMKCKSTLFRGVGVAQAKLGAATGMDQLENRGHEWEEWATHTSREADLLREQGAPSRLHGEYSRVVGYLGKAIGHVAGDAEMQQSASQRTVEANEEINESKKSSA